MNKLNDLVPYGRMVPVGEVALKNEESSTTIKETVKESRTHELTRLPVTGKLAVQKKEQQ